MLTLACRDESEVLAPLLADPVVAVESPVLSHRLYLINDGVVLALEDEAGGIYAETPLGPLSRDLDYAVPRELWPDLYAMVAAAADAEAFGADCRAEQLHYY